MHPQNETSNGINLCWVGCSVAIGRTVGVAKEASAISVRVLDCDGAVSGPAVHLQ